jgi:hypothetical protein
MKNTRNKLYAILTLTLLLAMTVQLVIQTTSAHDPPVEIPTYPYLAISPNPVGVDQSAFLIMWIHGAPPTAAGQGGDRYYFTLDITKPDGTTQSLGPYISDPTGSTYVSYAPDQIGTYEFVMNYPGQVVKLNHPETGIPGEDRYGFLNDTLLPSSTTEFLTVQEQPIEKIPDYPLPTEFWTRPIEAQNTAWAKLASNWLGGAHIGYVYAGSQNLFQRDGIGPNSAHIMWNMPIEFGGVVGGTTEIPGVTFYSGGSYEGRFTYALSMYGNIYFLAPLNHAGGSRASGSAYMSVDMRTGETNWVSEEIGIPYTGVFASAARPLIKGQLYDYEAPNQHGVVGGIIWQEADRGATWIAYDAFTGKWIFNLTDIPRGTEVYTEYGEIERYVFDYGDRWMALWTSAALPTSPLVATPGTTTNAYQFRPIGKTLNMSSNIVWNVTLPDLSGDASPRILKVIPGDLILGTSSAFPGLGGRREGLPPDTITMWAISDKPGNRGQLIWKKSYPAPSGMLTTTLGPVDTDARVFTMSYVETFEWLGFSVDTGEQLWGPTGDDDFRAFQYYGGGEGGGQKGYAGYGNLYVQGFGGEVHAYDLTTGQLIWEYNNTNSGVETVWGYYPIFIAAIGDEKVYVFNNEHSPNAPLYKGEKVRALDAFTGEEIWTLTGWSGQTGGRGTSTAVLADGFFTYYSYYDNTVYCIGKGPSATTLQAPLTAITQGQTLMLTGTVTDQSPGAVGTPAMSDESMSSWMEYLYMQKPMPMDATGVEVVLETYDPNGNYYEIGRATSDTDGNYALMWEPEVPGEYKIIASFLGSDSYWGSDATAYVGVVEAPQPTPPPDATPAPMTDTYLAGSTIAIVAAIVVVAILLLRKK